MPELFLDVAKNLPEYDFKMIGSPLKSEIEYYNNIKNEIQKIENSGATGRKKGQAIEELQNKLRDLDNTITY